MQAIGLGTRRGGPWALKGSYSWRGARPPSRRQVVWGGRDPSVATPYDGLKSGHPHNKDRLIFNRAAPDQKMSPNHVGRGGREKGAAAGEDNAAGGPPDRREAARRLVEAHPAGGPPT